MKTEKATEFVRSNDLGFQGKLPKKQQVTVHLLDNDETFRCCERPSNSCCLYQKIAPMLLSPYDVACMRKATKLTSSDFFGKYAELALDGKNQDPRAFLNFTSTSKKRNNQCPFRIEENDNTFDARPLGCRIYPVIRGIDNQGITYFARIDEDEIKPAKKSQKFTLETWIKHVDAKKWLAQSERYESLLRHIVNQQNYTFSEQEKMTIASMLYTPDAYASEDLFGSYLKKPELAIEALGFGYSRAKRFIAIRAGNSEKN